MKKRIGEFLLFTAMVFSVIAETAKTEEYTYNGTTFTISYEIHDKNVKIFKSLNGNSDVGETAINPIPEGENFEIPAKIDGKKVTIIGHGAFKGCKFEKVKIPLSVKTIETEGFADCDNLKEFRFSAGIETIEAGVLQGCNALIKINIDSFWAPSDLSFGSGLGKLQEINFGKHFRFASIDGLVYDKKKTQLFYCPIGKTGEVNIPKGVKLIQNDVAGYLIRGTFQDCKQITAINLPETLNEISQNAFKNCVNEKFIEIKLPKNVEKIGNNAFVGCTSLKKVFFLGKKPKIISGSVQPTTAEAEIFGNQMESEKLGLSSFVSKDFVKTWQEDDKSFPKKYCYRDIFFSEEKFVTFTDGDKKSVQKFVSNFSFSLASNKIVKKGNIFIGWKEKDSATEYYDGEIVTFSNEKTLEAQWVTESTMKSQFDAVFDKNFVGLVNNVGLIDFTVNKSGKVTGKTINEKNAFSFSSLVKVEKEDDKYLSVINFEKAGQQKFKMTFDTEKSCWKVNFISFAGENLTESLTDNLYPTEKNFSAANSKPVIYTVAQKIEETQTNNSYFLKTDYTGSYIIGTMTIDKKANVKFSLILPDDTKVNCAGKICRTGIEDNNLQIVIFSSLYGKNGFFQNIYKMENVNSWLSYGTNIWKNSKPKTSPFTNVVNKNVSCTLAISRYDNDKILADYKIFDFNKNLSIESENFPDYPVPVKEGKLTVYQLTEHKEIIQKLVLVSDKKFAKLEAKVGTNPAPWYESKKFTWNYENDKSDKIIVNPTGITFSLNQKTGLFTGKFNVFYDYKPGEKTNKHFITKSTYKGVLFCDYNNTAENKLYKEFSGFGTGLIPRTDYEETDKPGKFIKYSGKQPAGVILKSLTD